MTSVLIQKYAEVRDTIVKSIENREYKPGERLPSIREMAEKTGYNNATVIRAYKQLESEGVIYSVDRSGYYVMEIKPPHSKNIDVIDFMTPTPGRDILPYKDYISCISKAVELYGSELFTYVSLEGFEQLRKVLSGNLMNEQIFTSPDNISITAGSQQALDIISRMEFPNRRDAVLVEQPSYSGIMKILLLNRIKAIGIERDEGGFDLENLENLFANSGIKLFYTTPRFSNPLGISLDNETKKHIVKLAKKYDVYIVEDDYLGDIDTDNRNDPIYSFDDSGHVVYVKSFSKTFLPGIRIGLAVLPKKLKEGFENMKWASSLGTSAISQGALEIYMKSGMFENHIKHLKGYYNEKMNETNRCLDKYLPEGFTHGQSGTGFFSYIKLPHYMDDEEITADLKSKGVLVTPCSRFYLPEFKRRNFLRICISSTPDDKLEEGIIMICETLRNHTQNTGAGGNTLGI